MQRSNNGPPCPSPKRIRELINVVGDSTITGSLENEHDLIDALEWLATSLENRSLYHKKQQIKKRILTQLAEEHGLTDVVNALTNESLHSFVSNQPPSPEEEKMFNLTKGDDTNE